MVKMIRVSAKARKEIEAALRRLAREAEVFIDGDVYKKMIPDSSVITGDDFRVEDKEFTAVKKTLFKLKRVARITGCDASLQGWIRSGDGVNICMVMDRHPKSCRVVYPIEPAMAAALDGGIGTEEWDAGGVPVLSVFGPVRDSLEDVVGVVEVYGSLAPEKYRVDDLDY